VPRIPLPAAIRGKGLRPRIRLEVLVDENGRVIQAVPLTRDASGLGFERRALAAAHKTRFRPATRDGVRVKMWTDLSVQVVE
jgi:TonB family protein